MRGWHFLNNEILVNSYQMTIQPHHWWLTFAKVCVSVSFIACLQSSLQPIKTTSVNSASATISQSSQKHFSHSKLLSPISVCIIRKPNNISHPNLHNHSYESYKARAISIDLSNRITPSGFFYNRLPPHILALNFDPARKVSDMPRSALYTYTSPKRERESKSGTHSVKVLPLWERTGSTGLCGTLLRRRAASVAFIELGSRICCWWEVLDGESCASHAGEFQVCLDQFIGYYYIYATDELRKQVYTRINILRQKTTQV